ncbi:TIGR02757 family protein [Dysgonomonas sp. HGC4]|uniref:TIGR02757 family protein n=1 Tax=Dysgonomonas sp. HGC4 TaxID=1658009 RepID=UPI000682DB18|nr:TIGR02757 family protein [Dysgonomonas sp. HGC4]MBD8349650.1 TIGR02757 family protein [Dysgonomonas sp. HGC4]
MAVINFEYLKDFLDQKVLLYNRPQFIENDPICIPHAYCKCEDIEIMGFFAAIFAWGQRPTIIKKCKELSQRMDNAPYEFITQHKDNDLKQLLGFKHRTFNDTDLLYCIDFFKRHYSKYATLESAFFPNEGMTVELGLNHFQEYFFNAPDAPSRTRKHIPNPTRKSACKRLNMYLRWMVRNDEQGVDFGLWKTIQPKDLICPLDLHVERTAKKIGILSRDKPDWAAAIELTDNLRLFDANDPVKYDFALFGISIEEKCIIDSTQLKS